MSEEQPANDFALLDAWCRGDRSAGGALVERHYARVARFFRGKVSEALQEDLIQETFLACTKNAARFRGEAQFRTFLCGIARNVLIGHLRRTCRSRTRLGSKADLEETPAAALEPSPAVAAARHEEQRLLLEALLRIPLPQQIVIGLHYWAELTVSEIGEVLRVPLGTAKTRLRDGRSQLEDQLRTLAPPDVRPSAPGDLDAWARRMRAQVPVARGGEAPGWTRG